MWWAYRREIICDVHIGERRFTMDMWEEGGGVQRSIWWHAVPSNDLCGFHPWLCPGSGLVLGASTSTMTPAAMISPALSSRPIPVVIGPLAIYVDQPVIFGLVGGRLMPTSKVVERALARGVVLTSTGPAVMGTWHLQCHRICKCDYGRARPIGHMHHHLWLEGGHRY